MRWEVKEREDGKFGIYLCQEFWKFPDQEVVYSVTNNKKCAVDEVKRLNESYSSDYMGDIDQEDNEHEDALALICENTL